jgi:ubiquinone/menaquinone biosynthesis C-methylase UbiE
MDKSAIKDHYNSVAEAYQNIQQFPERITDQLDITDEMTILDLGCGAGNLTFKLADTFNAKSITGIDISKGLIALAVNTREQKSLANVDFLCGDVECLPFGDESHDAITSNMVLHLFTEQFEVLKEANRVLKAGGKAVHQFQGQRPVAPEYFELLEEGWHDVLGMHAPFPSLFNVATVDEIDDWMRKLQIEKFEVRWISNTVHLNLAQFQGFMNYIPLVTGFWSYGLLPEEKVRIQERLAEMVEQYFNEKDSFTLTGNTIVLSYTKPALQL